MFNIFLGTLKLEDANCPNAFPEDDGTVLLSTVQRSFNTFNSIVPCPSLSGGGGAGAGLSSESAEVKIGSDRSIQGGTVLIPIELVAAPTDVVSAVELDILFKSSILEIPNPMVDCKLNIDLLEDHEIAAILPDSPAAPSGLRRLRLGIHSKFDSSSAVQTFNNGVMAYCRFQVLANAQGGDHELTADRMHVIGSDDAILDSTMSNGRVTLPCTSGCVGDCNCDGVVNAEEFALGKSIALSGGDLTMCEPFDTDSDGRVLVTALRDAMCRGLLGCNNPCPTPTPRPQGPPVPALVVGDAAACEASYASVSLSMSGSLDAVRALQFDIQYDVVEVLPKSPNGPVCVPGTAGLVQADITTDDVHFPPGYFRVLVGNFVTVIPNGELIRCSFQTHPFHGGQIVPISLGNVVVSNSSGGKMGFSTSGGEIMITDNCACN